MISSAEIHARVAWPETLQHLGIAPEFLRDKHGPCPACGGTDRYRFDNRNRRGDFFCNGCGAGSGFDLLMRVHGWNFSQTLKRVAEVAGLASDCNTLPPLRTTAMPDVAPRIPLDADGLALWDSCARITGVARSYLETRGCRLPPHDGDLRYHGALPHPSGYIGPALVALVTDAVTDEPLTLHRTWIQADGNKADVDVPRLLLPGHKKKGGVIKLWPSESVHFGLGIGEGIETCLAASHAFSPVWATVDAGNLGQLPVLAGIESLLIFSDNDPAGIKAANDAARRWKAAGCSVRVVMPPTKGADIADLVAGK